jgi:hypothetical protein
MLQPWGDVNMDLYIPIPPRCNYILNIPMTSPIALQDCRLNSQFYITSLN